MVTIQKMVAMPTHAVENGTTMTFLIAVISPMLPTTHFKRPLSVQQSMCVMKKNMSVVIISVAC